jgi:hypothetical protein
MMNPLALLLKVAQGADAMSSDDSNINNDVIHS